MLPRILALALYPAAAALLVTVVGVWSRRAPAPSAGARYVVEADVLVLVLPSVLVYVLTVPFVWRRLARLPFRMVALFASLAFALTMGGLMLLMGPVYRALSAVYPVVADHAFFWVFPVLPALMAVTLAVRVVDSPPRAT